MSKPTRPITQDNARSPFRSASSRSFDLIDPLCDENWTNTLESDPEATFFHTTTWARILKETYGYKPELARVLENGAPTLSLPIMEVASGLTGKRCIALPFTDLCSPIGPQKRAFIDLLEFLRTEGVARSWKYLELRGGAELIARASPSTTFLHHKCLLGTSEEALFLRLSSSTRRAIRKAERSRLKVSDTITIESLKAFYRLMQHSRKRQGLPPQPFRFFKNIYERALSRGKGRLFLAYFDHTAIAGALFFHHRKHAIYKFGASDKRFQELRANNLVMWRAMQSYANEGYEILDFGRTSSINEGLRRFKLGWGTVESKESYLRYDFPSRQFISHPDLSSGWHNRIFRLMPIPMLRAIGSLIYKHIA